MKIKLLRPLIITQVIIASILLVLVYYKQTGVLGAEVSVNPINKEDLVFTAGEDLKSFYEPKPNSSPTETSTWFYSKLKYIINSDSLRADHEYQLEESADTYRIVALGDSFTYGLLVDKEYTYPSQLEKLLNINLACKNFKKFEIINLGYPGYDIEYAVKRFEKRGQKYSPDLVLWFLKQDDFVQILKYTKEKKDLFDKQIRESGKLDEYYKQGKYFPAAGKAAFELKQTFGDDKILDYQRKALASFNKYYSDKLMVFSFPFLELKYKLLIEDFVKGREKTYYYENLVDIYELKEAFPDDHPNEKGYSTIAEDLFNYLTKNKIIPCD